jgi:hypothetical protein
MSDVSSDTAKSTGSTTVSRTLANHFSDAVNLADYGTIDPTGVTDSSAAFSAAYGAATAGAAIVVPAGRYTVGSPPSGNKIVRWSMDGVTADGTNPISWLVGTTDTMNGTGKLTVKSVTTATDWSVAAVERRTSHSGGAGNLCNTYQVYTSVNANVTNGEWGSLTVMDNHSGSSNTGCCASYVQSNKYGCGGQMGMCIESSDLTNQPSSIAGSNVTLELDNTSGAADDYGSGNRLFIHIVGAQVAGATQPGGVGAVMSMGFRAGQGTFGNVFQFEDSTPITKAVLDTTGASLATTVPVIKTSQGTMLWDRDGTGTHTISTGSGIIHFTNGAPDTMQITDAGDLNAAGHGNFGALLTAPSASISGNVALASMNGGQLAGFRNLIINGNFAINQRGATNNMLLAADTFAHDRWRSGSAGFTYTFAAASGAGTSPLDTVVTVPSGSGVSFAQVVEGANIAGGTYTLSWSGNAAADVTQGSTTTGLSNGGQITLAGGTNATVFFTNGNVSNVQLEPGNRATPFERRFAGIELMLAQRYYQMGVFNMAGGSPSSGIQVQETQRLPVALRTTPSVTLSNLSYTNTTGGAIGGSTTQVIPYAETTSSGQYFYSGNYAANAEFY